MISSTPHPLLTPQYLDGGFASQSPESRLNPRPQLSASSASPTEEEIPCFSNDKSASPSLALATPQMSAERSTSQGRMAVESLLLSEDAIASEGRKVDEMMGENASTEQLVCPFPVVSTPHELRSDQVDTGARSLFDEHGHQDLVVDRLKDILRVLPPREEMRRHVESFWRTSTWYNNILRREEFEATYEPAVYAPSRENKLSPHKLACVLIVLALAAYLDLPNDPDDALIAQYWEGMQRCFDPRFGWPASIPGVQALVGSSHSRSTGADSTRDGRG